MFFINSVCKGIVNPTNQAYIYNAYGLANRKKKNLKSEVVETEKSNKSGQECGSGFNPIFYSAVRDSHSP